MKDVFPFLALAPELRNRVYEDALTHDRVNGRLANVALLRVCKQIQKEAQPMLPDLVNACVISIASVASGIGRRSKLDVVVDGDIRSEPQPLPSILRHIPFINIELHAHASHPHFTASAGAFTRRITHFLAHAQVKQKIVITLYRNDTPEYGTPDARGIGGLYHAYYDIMTAVEHVRDIADVKLVGFTTRFEFATLGNLRQRLRDARNGRPLRS